MILGIGIDIVKIDRIQNLYHRFGGRFLQHIYSEGELELARNMHDQIGILAKRWAAKEACSKALGTGMTQGVAWRDIEVIRQRSGMPGLTLNGHSRTRLEQMLPANHSARLHLTMSDDRPCAVACVVIEAVPR
ncbi:MAG: holo-ACP synthase [Rhodobacteraceae bacterium]|nr:holo-ACP synthase [Paracoccaceae bacterium]